MEWLAIAGAALIGVVVPEFFVHFSRMRVPAMQNLVFGAGFALIAAYLTFK